MRYRGLLVILAIAMPAHAQISRTAKYDILRTVLADTASARMPLPFGSDGVDISESGEIDKAKDPRALARFLLVVLQGLRVLGHAHPDPGRLRDAAAQALSVLH